ncbi:unnamed protein product [Calypogeia fissa]
MVGHTHEDVDAMFGNFSESLMHHPVYTLPELMALLMGARTPSPVPFFVQEVPDFKMFVDPFILKGGDKLVGHASPRLFRLYVRLDGMPCMQFKRRTVDKLPWEPSEGVEMWGWTSDGRPNLPFGVPKRLQMLDVARLDEVRDGLGKFIKFFKVINGRTVEESTKIRWEGLVKYWSRINDMLELGKVQYWAEDGDNLVHGFWPVTNWRDTVPRNYRNVACELEAAIEYVGPLKNKPPQPYNPRSDIVIGHFVLVRPDIEDLDTYPIHMGQVVSDVEEGRINEHGQLEHVCNVE